MLISCFSTGQYEKADSKEVALNDTGRSWWYIVFKVLIYR
jgi:hypothetical protein